MPRSRRPPSRPVPPTLRSGIYVGRLRVVFQLQEPGSVDTAVYASDESQRRAQLVAMQDRIRQLEQEAAAQRARKEEPRATSAQIAELRRQMSLIENAATRSVIDTTFNMEVGETVVVGTSRVRGGDKALIALLTAVPKGTTLKRED